MAIRQIRKRNGSIVAFDRSKIERAIAKAVVATGGADMQTASILSEKVAAEIAGRFHKNSIPAVEEIQDIIEKVLIKEGHAQVAKAYILYRQKRSEIRDAKKNIFGFIDDSKLSITGASIARERYLNRDDFGKVIETPLEMFRRVAKSVASIERSYDGKPKEKEEEFYSMLTSLKFLPAGRILANAATRGQIANAYVIPIYDSLEDIYEAMKEQASVHKTGGGTGFDFSHLRPKNDNATTSGGIAAGPVSFLKLFDQASSKIKIGKRRASNMGILRVDHPDIMDFIVSKSRGNVLTNFNISVAITDEFIRAVQQNRDYPIINPRTGKADRKMSARQVFDLLVTTSWQVGDPGLVFIDRINKLNPTSHVGRIEATSACGETPLHPYEASVLGSINLDKFVRAGKVDWSELKRTAELATQFLDNCLDLCKYPLRKSESTTKQMRRIGLGVMGFADMLYQLKVAYGSEEAVRLAKRIMKTINESAAKASEKLAKERREFPLFRGSAYEKKRRNACVTAIAPTGSISMLADTSSGIEPNYAICYVKRVLEGKEFLIANRHFERIAREKGFYSEELMRKIARQGSLDGIDEVPDDLKRIFVVAHNVKPEWHVKIQGAFQKHVESAVSKTVNFPNNATMRDVEKVYMMAYKEGCKGITIYRDSSLDEQVMNVVKD